MIEDSKVLIVESRFYEDISDELCKGAITVLENARIEYERIAVPGAFEIPQAILQAIHSLEYNPNKNHFAGFIGLGCVIRGETSHYDYVCQEASRGMMDIAMEYRVALGYGILTVENHEQAWDRASVSKKNKGGDVANACLRMMEVKKYFHPMSI